jgi:hypothetical protein
MKEKLTVRETVRQATSAATLAFVGFLALNGCSDRAQNFSQDAIVVFKGNIENDETSYAVQCYGPNQEVVIEEDDTLIGIIGSEEVGTPTVVGGLGKKEIPKVVYAGAIAEMNQLPNPDMLEIDRVILLPEHCIAQPMVG